MKEISVRIISAKQELPPLACQNFFHSAELFQIAASTPQHHPYMAIAEDKDGSIVANLLMIIRWRKALFPPYLYSHARVYGEGAYANSNDKEVIFGLMLHALMSIIRHQLCFYVEFSDISTKMFGYRYFRKEGFFPVSWQEIHNSLRTTPPVDMLNSKTLQHIIKAKELGVNTREAKDEEDVHNFYRLLQGRLQLRIRRYIPPESQFVKLYHNHDVRIFLATYKKRVIGACNCVYSEGNAYLWYLAAKDKTFRQLRPTIMTLWTSIKYAYDHNYAHLYFMDAGLPYRSHPLRELILGFGGEPVTKYRWFRFNIPFFNSLLSRLYQE
jgi:hypothetical protein